MPKNTSDRLAELAKSNLLPDIKYTRNFEVTIRKGIMTELLGKKINNDIHFCVDNLGNITYVNMISSEIFCFRLTENNFLKAG
jgi:hypothetical protein